MPDFEKYQALGNDYLIVDPARVDVPAGRDSARILCDRYFGLGADGILFGSVDDVEPDGGVSLLIFNADGSECEKSGNGLRMFALYLAEHGVPRDRFVIRTIAGENDVRIVDAAYGLSSVDMGVPVFAGAGGDAVRSTLTVDGRELSVVRVHNGNPHVVVLLPDVSERVARELGPLIANHRDFPDRVNVQFARVLDRHTLEIEVWERGAGYTLASGAGSCAAASAAHAIGSTADTVTVRMPGGSNDISIADDGAVTMTGIVAKVMSGTFAPGLRSRLDRSGVVAR